MRLLPSLCRTYFELTGREPRGFWNESRPEVVRVSTGVRSAASPLRGPLQAAARRLTQALLPPSRVVAVIRGSRHRVDAARLSRKHPLFKALQVSSTCRGDALSAPRQSHSSVARPFRSSLCRQDFTDFDSAQGAAPTSAKSSTAANGSRAGMSRLSTSALGDEFRSCLAARTTRSIN